MAYRERLHLCENCKAVRDSLFVELCWPCWNRVPYDLTLRIKDAKGYTDRRTALVAEAVQWLQDHPVGPKLPPNSW